ncbi:MAG: lantibiotic immunity ABC transporter MutE/EpiE family permease subunit [Eubacteriales bacterium]|nr:lantibiotic immunity ABC transporter MutE/EpiE family permease subunit [Eubacteriales bacterium]
MKVISSELLKYKRTLTRKLIVGIPLFFSIQSAAGVLLMPKGIVRTWDLVIAMVFNVWTVMFLPFGMALFAFLVDNQEQKAGHYRSLLARPNSPVHIWLGKIIVMAFHALLSTGVLVVAILISGMITARGQIPWDKIIMGSIVSWTVSLALIPMQLWAATWRGLFASMALGFIGFLMGVVSALTSYWVFIPWAWGIRLMSPMIGVHPNGTLLEAGDKLLDTSIIPVGIGISLLAFVVITMLSALWFNRREVK